MLLLGALPGLVACATDFRPVLAALDPPNRATNVALSATPVIEFADDVAIDLQEGQRRFVLYDVTRGGRVTVPGRVEIDGRRLRYLPDQLLEVAHDYRIELAQDIASGDKLLDVDGSEWPDEPIAWPFTLTFRTRSGARVRALYQDFSRDFSRLVVRFSQPMDQTSDVERYQLFDATNTRIELAAPVWIADDTVRLDLRAQLEPADVYELWISRRIRSEDAFELDGNDNGVVGEDGDDYVVQFTGSQKVVRSRIAD
ncbi:MAG: Ig-like domain-containing protein [Deltaproteobacteria bacterium]|nr:Ig-like domain-containing protein [Deltaproteobacteria bacterium]